MKKLLLLIVVSCTQTENIIITESNEDMRMFISTSNNTNTPNISGVCLTFDDYTRTQTWIDYHNNYGAAKGWRASFFINQLGGASVLADYVQLDAWGHEINNHTTNHYNGVNNYIDSGGTPQGYYETYIKPLDDYLIAAGIPKPPCFRFPYNYTNKTVKDWLLANHYGIVSPVVSIYTTGMLHRTYDCIYDFDNEPEALNIQISTPDYDTQIVIDLLQYAKDNNKVVMFLGHSIGPQGTFISVVDINLLNAICDFVNANEMKFYLASELKDLAGTSTAKKNTSYATLDTVVENGGTLKFDMTVLTHDLQTFMYDMTFKIYNNGVLYHTVGSSTLDSDVTTTNSAISIINVPRLTGQTYNFTVKSFDEDGEENLLSGEIIINT